MKRLVWLIALFLITPHCSHPAERGVSDTTVTAETICVTTEFSVEIDYPNFVVSILAHLTGAHIESLTFVEWEIRTPMLNSFLFHLTEGQNPWLEIASDSAYPSFVKLPREDRAAITPRALIFIKGLVEFFRTPRTDTLHGVFEYGQDTLGALAFQKCASTDSAFHVTTVSCVKTWSTTTGEGYINGEVKAVTQEGYTSYPDIKIFLEDKKVAMRFTPLKIRVARTRP